MPLQKITEVTGRGIVLMGNDIDTDRIIPARFMKEVTFANMGKYAFYDERFDGNGNKKIHPFNDEKYEGASILIVNKNFGCGSSREHAPQSLMRWGIKAIIGESFADIFAGNCSMLGLPTVTASKEDVEKLMGFVHNNSHKNIKLDIKNRKIGFDATTLKLGINESIRKSLVEGMWDQTSLLLEAKEEIKKTMSRLPYLNNFE
ncbi:3-isopropylmalate dehydratase small subunit [Candidatus Woesearchaeota archaeon]|nr:3-isopropylmalate dehydratase small subunit [Candidatus Woesearchaeota archaeon]